MDNWMTPSENENLESPKMLSYEQHLLLLEGKSIHRSRNHILSHVPTTFSKSQFSKCSNTNKAETLYFSSHSTLEKMTLCFRWFLNPPPAPNLNLSVKNGKKWHCDYYWVMQWGGVITRNQEMPAPCNQVKLQDQLVCHGLRGLEVGEPPIVLHVSVSYDLSSQC